MADGDEPREVGPGGDLGSLKAWSAYAVGELQLEQQRTSETRQRADSVIRNSALLVTLVTGITGAPRLFQQDVRTPACAWVLLVLFAAVLFVAMWFAVAATWNVTSKVTHRESVSTIPDMAWQDTEPEALLEILRQPAANLPSLREANDRIVARLGISHLMFAVALPLGFAAMLAALVG